MASASVDAPLKELAPRLALLTVREESCRSRGGCEAQAAGHPEESALARVCESDGTIHLIREACDLPRFGHSCLAVDQSERRNRCSHQVSFLGVDRPDHVTRQAIRVNDVAAL